MKASRRKALLLLFLQKPARARPRAKRRRPTGAAKLMREQWKALSLWRKARSAQALSLLEDPRAPPPEVDFERPWWLGLLTSYPEVLASREREGCEMLLALPARGAPAPDWRWIHGRAEEIFKERGAAAGSRSEMRMIDRMDGERPWGGSCGGSATLAMPGVSGVRSAGIRQTLRAFDRRRAARRAGRPPPAAWAPFPPEMGQRLWELGASASALATEGASETWQRSVAAAAQALAEHGAIRVHRVPGFFALFPEAMLDPRLMERIHFDMLDPMRQRWAMGESSRAPAREGRPRSI